MNIDRVNKKIKAKNMYTPRQKKKKKTDHLRKLLKMKFKCELRGNFRNNIIGIVFILKITL